MHYSFILAGAGVSILLYLIARVVYLAFFHPLAKYPGPFLSKFTCARASFYAWRGDIHIDIWRCHEKYGDYMRYGPNQLYVNTEKGLRDIYGPTTSNKFLKSSHYEVMSHQAANTFTHRGGKEHLRRRRIMSQAVSTKAQLEYEPRLMTHIQKFCDLVLPPSTSEGIATMNMAEWCNYLAFDLMTDVVFGARYNLLGDKKFRYVPEMIEKSNVRVSSLVQFPGLTWMRLDKHLFQEAIYARNRFLKFVFRLLHDRKALSHDGTACGVFKKPSITAQSSLSFDVYSRLQDAQDPVTGEGFGHDEIASESTTLIVAGSDTSACAMASILFYLANNPSAYTRAAAEVRAAAAARDASRPGHLSVADLAGCTYLRACIDEALRMSPPVGTGLMREVVTPGGMVVDGQVVPAGCEVGVGTYAIHHSARAFDDPFVYRPERWLTPDEEEVRRARACFVPFSAGIRSCLGKGLAYTEMTLTIGHLLLLGDFKLADGELATVGRGSKSFGVEGRHREGEYQLYDHIAGQKNGPWLQFTRRVNV
ncbi:cytochrome P450 3A31 [Periconia macrospinosa]|uniref:Cytochrome P450 3A31 n=1 Tax=Periconia macrospinosa TaxID=97972 RepID=A0A2V1E7Z7_9PLEO|nr:cytochrome P450 3A31 [Periconia macrospinosa]